MKKILLSLFLILSLLYLGFCWYLSGLIIHGPPRRDISDSIKKMQIDWNIDRDSMLRIMPKPTEVSFAATPLPASPHYKEKTPILHGWLFASGKDTASCAVVMAHGFTDNRSGLLKYTAPYRDCGCELLLYDHRAHYMSGHDNLVTGGIYEAKDVEAAHRFIAEKFNLQDNQIGWMGESWGGAAVLIAGGNNNIRPAFITTDSAYSSWRKAIGERAVKMFGSWINGFFSATFFMADMRLGIDHRQASPELAAAKIQVPTLLVHSAADVETSPDQSQAIYDNFSDKELAQLELLDWNSWHAQSAARRPAAYTRMVKDFVDKHVNGFCQ